MTGLMTGDAGMSARPTAAIIAALRRDIDGYTAAMIRKGVDPARHPLTIALRRALAAEEAKDARP